MARRAERRTRDREVPIWLGLSMPSVIAVAPTTELWWIPLAFLSMVCFVGIPLGLYQNRR